MSNDMEQREERKRETPPDEKRIDQAIEDTFPCSDPPATTGGITKINPDRRTSADEEGESAPDDKP
jgi:hypothetical protein